MQAEMIFALDSEREVCEREEVLADLTSDWSKSQHNWVLLLQSEV